MQQKNVLLNHYKNTISFPKLRLKVFLILSSPYAASWFRKIFWVIFIIFISGKQIKLRKFIGNNMKEHNFTLRKMSKENN